MPDDLARPRSSDGADARLNEQIFGLLSAAIADGRLPAGGVLRETSIMRGLGATRAPVRQALSRLRKSGLIGRYDGGGDLVGGAGGRAPPPQPLSELDLVAILSAGTPPSIRKVPAWARHYDVIERAVIHRAAFGSASVNELELARHYGIGRPVARDILTRLESNGMLVRDERQRWSVVPLDAARVTHLNELRDRLETLALAQSFERLARDRLVAMRDSLLRQIALYPRVEAASMDALEHDLHVACLAFCPNRELLAILQRTRCVLTLSKHVLGAEMPMPEQDPFLTEHLEVLDRLLAGDVTGATVALSRHLASATPKVIGRLGTFRTEFAPPVLPFLMSRGEPRDE